MKLESNKDISFLIKPLLTLAFSVLLLVLVAVFGLKKITELRTQITALESSQKTLLAKVSILRNVSETIPEDMTNVNLALPSKGAVVYALSQVKNQAASNGLSLSNIKAGNTIPGVTGVSKTSINFDVDGDQNTIMTYLNNLTKSLPVMKIDKIKLDQASGTSRASVSLNVYSAELPRRIPSLTSPVTELTAAEMDALTEISGYTSPDFTEPLPEDTGGKEDPFN